MEFSRLLSASSPAPHSSVTHSSYLGFDWLPESMEFCNPNVNGAGDGGSPSSESRPLTQGSLTINPSLRCNEFRHRAVSSPSVNGAENLVKRMLYGAGEFQNNKRAESPVWSESSMIIEGMSRACRYSPEEKKQRIERYRSKRSLRNFNKKIKYACRKSLADSRPRIRGRFARYDEDQAGGKNYPMAVQWSRGREEEEEEEAAATGEDNNWIKYFIDTYSGNLIP